jgi:1-deoxyxylulose-5-phosphate synthase
MQYARLGSSGLKVSRIALGMMSYGSQTEREWHLGEDDAEPIVRRAIEAGVSFFDTADTYSDGLTEEITGRLLAKLFGRRDDYVLATKVFFPMGPGPNDRGLSRKHVLAAIDDSLRRLGTDYVDLYQLHRWADETPIEETIADATVDPADGLTTPAITSKAGAAGTRASKAVLPLMVAASTRVRKRTWQGLRWAPSA